MKPGFALSVSIFVVVAVGMFTYFNCLPDDVLTVGPDVDYDLCSVKANEFSCCKVFSCH
jgi:hypothetical protein